MLLSTYRSIQGFQRLARISPVSLRLRGGARSPSIPPPPPLHSTSSIPPPPSTLPTLAGLAYHPPTHPKVLFVLGGPGAGKGTQCARILQHYPAVHLSVGALLRADGRPEIQQMLHEGTIVPVATSLALVRREMAQHSPDALFLIDGFPRNADNWAGWQEYMDVAVLGTLLYTCPLPILQDRILHRTEGRSDDNVETLQRRFASFEQDTLPVVESLSYVARLYQIDAAGTPNEVWDATDEALDDICSREAVAATVDLLQAVSDGNATRYRQLCDDSWFEDKSAAQVMEAQEVPVNLEELHDGTLTRPTKGMVHVTYTRPWGEERIREERIWQRQDAKWTLVHFVRKPVGV